LSANDRSDFPSLFKTSLMIGYDLILYFKGRILCGSQLAVNRITAGGDWSDDLARRLMAASSFGDRFAIKTTLPEPCRSIHQS
jgi:hypothetical protein